MGLQIAPVPGSVVLTAAGIDYAWRELLWRADAARRTPPVMLRCAEAKLSTSARTVTVVPCEPRA